MKQFTKYSLFSMALLAGAAAFTACSSDDNIVEETAPVNPSYNGETVKTQFAINIPRAAGADKRMTPGNTQNEATVNFLGMDNVYLMAMDNDANDITATSVISDVFNLPAIKNTEISTSNGQKIYKDIAIPVGTTDFLFYGQAPAASTGTELEKKFARGVLNYTFPTAGATGATPADVKFSLQTIATDYHANSALLNQLNAVAGAEAQTDASKTWAETEDESLKALYTAFTGLKAGSANAIKATLEDLYNAVLPISKIDDGTNYTDEIAQDIMDAITTDTYGLFNATETTTGSGTYTLSWKNDNDDAKFPTALGLPEGAVELSFTSGQFSYENTGIQIGGTPNVDVNSITYPARLTYYAVTPLKANNAVVDTWGWESNSWTGWDDEVLASTHSIALENKINYGVAALETTVKFSANTIGDNQPGHIINIGADDFTLTGILVGGQPTEVLYNMEPANTTAFTQTVWDCDMPETGMDIPIASGNTTANYTLLLDDKNKSEKKVQFALELQNNSTSTIYGQGGIIKPGMKFYLVGQLDPTTGTGNATAPDPADGNVDHVFIKDYLTKANVTISSFKNAYVTIPDLRSTQLQLGLYVDLTWQKGYTFNVEIGEN